MTIREDLADGADVLEAVGIQKAYDAPTGRLEVLRGVDLKVRRGTVLAILGVSGAGKSTLVRELHEPVLSARAFFAAGKCDQYSRQTPYRVLGHMCSSLVAQLLTRDDEAIGRWRSRLTEAVGPHGRLITDLVPELATLIVHQPSVVELPVSEAEGRFFRVFWRFLMAFASAEHTLVLFFDDLQWADDDTSAPSC